MKIAFYCKQFSLRGTEVCVYDYADYNEKILGNKSIIVAPPNVCMDSYEKFKNRFEVQIKNIKDIKDVDYIYVKKSGEYDGTHSDTIPTLIHVVFRHNEPHGHRYVYISDWLAKDQGHPISDSLPCIVNELPKVGDLREELNLKGKTVFGRYGGLETFDIQFVRDTITRITAERDDIVFLFMNTNRWFGTGENIIHLDGTYDQVYKTEFVNTCDAMIHARTQGESFGFAVAEFSMANKPVITWSGSEECAHIDMLGNHGIYYSNEDELYDIINNLSNYIKYDDYSELYKGFAPEPAMERFNKIFLQ